MAEPCSRSEEIGGIKSDLKTLFNVVNKIDALAESSNKTANSIERMATAMEHMQKDVIATSNAVDGFKEYHLEIKHMKGDIEELSVSVSNLTDKPAKKWESAVNYLISAVVSGLIAYFFVKIGLS